VWQFGTGNRKFGLRARIYSKRENKFFFNSSLSSCGRRAKCAGYGRAQSPIFVSARCLLQVAKAGSAATLPQQEKNNSVDAQRGGFIPRGDVSSTSLIRWPLASRRSHHHRCMLEP
jgi:hypothetical protein